MKGSEATSWIGNAANFIPGWIGNIIGLGTAVPENMLKAEETLSETSQAIGENVRLKSGAAYRELRNQTDEYVADGLGEATTSTIGGAAGGALALAAVPLFFAGPPGWIAGALIGGVGAIAGGVATSKVYRKIHPEDKHCAVTAAAMIGEEMNCGKPVDGAYVASVLLKQVKDPNLSKDLMKMAGTDNPAEALANGQVDVLNQLKVKYNSQIAEVTGLPLPAGSNVIASDAYAEALMNGEMPIRSLLDPARSSSMAMVNDRLMDQINMGGPLMSPEVMPELPGKPRRGNSQQAYL